MSSRIASAGPSLAEWSATVDGVPVEVVKLEDDPECLRASLGGDAIGGYYLTFRGDHDRIERLLEAGLAALRRGRQ